jgi:hypothetical protein
MPIWVPPEDRDTQYYIFNEQFYCQMKFIETLSVEQIREYGMPYSGDAYYDRQTPNEVRSYVKTINEMVEFFKKGATIIIPRQADTAKIYQRVQDHLLAWRNYLDRTVNPNVAPLQDLIDLDNFAQAIHPYAKKFFTKEEHASVFKRHLGGLSRVDFANILGPSPDQETQDTAGAPVPEKSTDRESMADLFASHRQNGAYRWDTKG